MAESIPVKTRVRGNYKCSALWRGPQFIDNTAVRLLLTPLV